MLGRSHRLPKPQHTHTSTQTTLAHTHTLSWSRVIVVDRSWAGDLLHRWHIYSDSESSGNCVWAGGEGGWHMCYERERERERREGGTLLRDLSADSQWYIILLSCNYEMLRLILKLLSQKPAQPASAPEASSSSWTWTWSLFLLSWNLFLRLSLFLSLCCGFCKCLEWIAEMPTYNILNYDNQRCFKFFFPLRPLIQIGCDHWSCGCHPVRCSNWHSLARETLWNVVLCLKLFPRRIFIFYVLCRNRSIAWEAMVDKFMPGWHRQK